MMELITWTATGLGVGWLVRTAMRSRREFGLLGDLTTGWLGGVVGRWLFRRLGVIAPDDAAVHVVVALVGASALLLGLRVLRRATFVARVVAPADVKPPLADLDEYIRGLGQLERRILGSLLTRQPAVRDRSDAKNDDQVNVRAEMQIVGLHVKLDALREEALVRLARLVEEHQRALGALNSRLGPASTSPPAPFPGAEGGR